MTMKTIVDGAIPVLKQMLPKIVVGAAMEVVMDNFNKQIRQKEFDEMMETYLKKKAEAAK